MHQRSSSKLRFDQGTMMMKFIRQGNYCLFSHIHKLIKMASDGHAKIYFVLGKLKLSLSCMKSVSSKSIDWACTSNQCFDALIEIKKNYHLNFKSTAHYTFYSIADEDCNRFAT